MKPHETVTDEQTAAGLQWLSLSNKEALSGIKSIARSSWCNTHHAHIQTGSGWTGFSVHNISLPSSDRDGRKWERLIMHYTVRRSWSQACQTLRLHQKDMTWEQILCLLCRKTHMSCAHWGKPSYWKRKVEASFVFHRDELDTNLRSF